MASYLSPLSLFFLLFNLVSSQPVVEEGYTVTTVIDGHKLKINPYSVIAPPGSSDLVVLDSSNSVFYTLSFPLSQESVVKRLSGNGTEGYSDGEPAFAQFKRPKSFTVDVKGNIYVADKNSNVIRKITKSGVTTIAGSYNNEGREDGPALNATFSNDFELTFCPHICALLVSDHGTQLIRQINLKSEDCARSSPSALGAVSIWVLGLVLSCIVGLVIGIVVRPYIIPHTGRPQPPVFQRDMEALPNQSDSDDLCGCEINKSQIYANQLKDLISFDRKQDLLTQDIFKEGHRNQETSDVLCNSQGKLDGMLQANIIAFAGKAKETTPEVGSLVSNSALVRRRK